MECDNYYKYLINQLSKATGLHSLRHTYGILWADQSILNPNLNIDKAQTLCQFGMGQKSIKSVLSYFTIRANIRSLYMNKLLEENENHDLRYDNYIKTKLSIVNEYYRRSI